MRGLLLLAALLGACTSATEGEISARRFLRDLGVVTYVKCESGERAKCFAIVDGRTAFTLSCNEDTCHATSIAEVSVTVPLESP